MGGDKKENRCDALKGHHTSLHIETYFQPQKITEQQRGLETRINREYAIGFCLSPKMCGGSDTDSCMLIHVSRRFVIAENSWVADFLKKS